MVEHGQRIRRVDGGSGVSGFHVDGGSGVAGFHDDGGSGVAGFHIGRCFGRGRRRRDQFSRPVGHERRVDPVGHDVLVGHQRSQERCVCLDPGHGEIAQGADDSYAGGVEVLGVGDHLDEHRVERGIGRHSDVGGGVAPDSRPAGQVQGGDRAVGRAHRPVDRDRFGVDPHLDGGSSGSRERLGQSDLIELVSGCDEQLGSYQIQPPDGLGDRVLDLEPRVGLDEPARGGVVAVDQELDGGQPPEVERGTETEGLGFELPARGHVDRRARGHLDQLLVATLEGALPLSERHHPASVADDLDLDVAGVLHQLLGVQIVSAERGRCLRSAALPDGVHVVVAAHHPDASSSPSADGLDDDPRGGAQLGQQCPGRAGIGDGDTGQDGQTEVGGECPGRGLVAQGPQDRRARTDEGHVGLAAGLGQLCALGQETVTGVDEVSRCDARGGDDQRDVQEGRCASAGELDLFVTVAEVRGGRFVTAVDADAGPAELANGAGYSYCDLAAVGDQYPFHGHGNSRFVGQTRPSPGPSASSPVGKEGHPGRGSVCERI